jgi:hypothetical protein
MDRLWVDPPKVGCLTEKEMSTAIDHMKNILLDAKDEPRFTSEPLHIYRT